MEGSCQKDWHLRSCSLLSYDVIMWPQWGEPRSVGIACVGGLDRHEHICKTWMQWCRWLGLRRQPPCVLRFFPKKHGYLLWQVWLLLHTAGVGWALGAFIHRLRFLHGETFLWQRIGHTHTKQLLHTNAFRHPKSFTHLLFHTDAFGDTETFTHWCV